jgi:hypothetical protein
MDSNYKILSNPFNTRCQGGKKIIREYVNVIKTRSTNIKEFY